MDNGDLRTGSDCPKREELTDFLQGCLSLETIEHIAEHLDGCRRCEFTLAKIAETQEPVFAYLKNLHPKSPFVDEAECQELKAQAKAIGTKCIFTKDALGPFYLPGSEHFAIRRCLGKGPVGMVCHAERRADGGAIAMKILPASLVSNPSRVKSFLREVAQVGALPGSRVIPILDVQRGEDLLFLHMPYIEGTNLGEIIQAQKGVKHGNPVKDTPAWACKKDMTYIDQILLLLDQIIDAVSAIHGGKCLHRNLKPSNCLVSQDQTVWLSDCALPELVNLWGDLGPIYQSLDRTSQGRIPVPDLVVRNPGFLSPEQWCAKKDIDQRADVFALGVIIYQAVTLKLPFGSSFLNAQKPLPKAPSEIHALLPAEFDPIILKALHPDRERRYLSAFELQEEWQQVRKSFPVRSLPNSDSSKKGRWETMRWPRKKIQGFFRIFKNWAKGKWA